MTSREEKVSRGDMGARPCVSAIVISYYTGPVLSRALSSLAAQEDLAEIILIDNGNPAGAIDAAIENIGVESPPIEIISGHGNIGFAAACNIGAAKALGDYLLFFNPDAAMPENGLATLLTGGRRQNRPWMIGPKLVDPDGAEQQGSRRETLTPWRAFVEVTRLDRLAPHHPYFRRFNLHKEACPEDIITVPTISGACFLLPKAGFDAIGGMDERYFLHVEDVDFCLRFSKAGGKVYFDPHVSVVHHKSSSRANPIKIEARKTKGMIRYFKTHFSGSYPAPFLWLVNLALWCAFCLLFVKRAFLRIIRLMGIARRKGARGAARARSISARKSSR